MEEKSDSGLFQGKSQEDASIGRGYNRTAQQGGVKSRDVIYGFDGDHFQSLIDNSGLIQILGTDMLNKGTSNAFLIYDAKTPNGLKSINVIGYTFNDPSQKQKALLGVIAIKK